MLPNDIRFKSDIDFFSYLSAIALYEGFILFEVQPRMHPVIDRLKPTQHFIPYSTPFVTKYIYIYMRHRLKMFVAIESISTNCYARKYNDRKEQSF